MKKTLLLGLFLSACIDKCSCSDNAAFQKNVCTELVNRAEHKENVCLNYGCQYIEPIIKIIIECNNITLSNLIHYEESSHTGKEYFKYPVILAVSASEIPVIRPHAFKKFSEIKNLTVLVLENIGLKIILPAGFSSLDRLREIYLGGNMLTAILEGIFNTMKYLEKLDVSNNKIQTIATHAFVGTNLKKLNLYNNNLPAVGDLFHDLETLNISQDNQKNYSFHGSFYRYLNLSRNFIETIDFGILREVSGLVDISLNKITRITNFSLSGASTLILNHNQITDFEKNDHANILDLSYNRLNIIGSGLFNPKLLKFFASFNHISSLNATAFFGLYNLTHLYLDNNNLSSIPNSCFKDLISLTHLNLSSNKLTLFNFGTFDSLLRLQILDISSNSLKELPQFTIHSLTDLTHLFFQDNEISDIDIDVLVEHLHQLKQINLNDNSWSCRRLAYIIHTLKRNKVYVFSGDSWERTNIHSIQCYKTNPNTTDNIYTDTHTKTESNLDDSNMNGFLNEDFRKSDMYNYFNKDFESSSFYKYLETLRNHAANISKSEKLDQNNLIEIVNSFKTIAKGLENISKETKSYYYNNNSKGLTINGTETEADYIKADNIKTDKLIGSPGRALEFRNYTGLLSIIAALLLINTCIAVSVAYFQLFHRNKYTLTKKEEVELI